MHNKDSTQQSGDQANRIEGKMSIACQAGSNIENTKKLQN